MHSIIREWEIYEDMDYLTLNIILDKGIERKSDIVQEYLNNKAYYDQLSLEAK